MLSFVAVLLKKYTFTFLSQHNINRPHFRRLCFRQISDKHIDFVLQVHTCAVSQFQNVCGTQQHATDAMNS